jgi:hypothetical protein
MTTRLVLQMQHAQLGGSHLGSRTARLWESPGGRIFACSGVEGERARVSVTGVARYEAAPQGDVVFATPEPDAASELVREIFTRFVRPIVFQLRGAEVLHASAVRGSKGVTAFIGPSMSGKSTLATALSAQGHPLLADDMLVWRALPQGIVATALDFEPRLRAQASALGLVPRRIITEGEAPLAAICVVERAAATGVVTATRLEPAEASRVVLAQALAFWWADEERNRTLIANYLELIARVPVCSLSIPWDLARLDETAASVTRLVIGEPLKDVHQTANLEV